MTVGVVMNDNIGDYSDKELSSDVTGLYATWVNGSETRVRGYLPIIGNKKTIKSDVSIGAINEIQASSFGVLQYQVPEDSSEDVMVKKVFITGKV